MTIPEPDIAVKKLKLEDKIYSTKTLSSMLGQTARVQSMTQEQYDAMSEHDENTLYVIINKQ